jgi:hypothetical protein
MNERKMTMTQTTTLKTPTVEMTPSLTQSQREIVSKVKALQNLTAQTGMRTTRSVLDILNKLGAEDLAAVSRVLYPSEN